MTKTNQQKVKDFLINNGVIIVMFILVIYTGFTSDNFFTRNNFMNILMNMSSRLVIALGIAGCVITAGCDLSAGRMIGFGACISGMLLQRMDYSGKFFPDMQPMNVFLALIVVMAICAAFGSITGFFIAYLSVPPFIATLAMMEIVYGISLIYTGATPLGGYVKSYTDIANGKFLGISMLQSIPGIVFAYCGFGGAMTVFILTGFIKGIPYELEEAAAIDGCSPEGTFFRIILPLLKPVIVTVTILNGMWIWNDYLLPSLMLGQNGKVKTLPVAVQAFVGSYVKQWDLILTAALLAMIPMIIVFLLAQKQIMNGMVEGAIK